jgi:hypothetical protein
LQTAVNAAACLYYADIDPISKQEVYVACNLRDRKLQWALLQFFKPDNYFEVRKALEQAGRAGLIGHGRDALIPAQPRLSSPNSPPPARNQSKRSVRKVFRTFGGAYPAAHTGFGAVHWAPVAPGRPKPRRVMPHRPPSPPPPQGRHQPSASVFWPRRWTPLGAAQRKADRPPIARSGGLTALECCDLLPASPVYWSSWG